MLQIMHIVLANHFFMNIKVPWFLRQIQVYAKELYSQVIFTFTNYNLTVL